jgi:two-component system sensor histidine kinase ArlS
MPVRFRITLMFVLSVFIIMGVVCTSVYYISAKERVNTIKTRLTNRAITIGRLLERRETFDPNLIRQFDSLTAVSLKEKLIQVYNSNEDEIYRYSEVPNDHLEVDKDLLKALENSDKSVYFKKGEKEAIAYKFGITHEMFIISAANDKDGKLNLIRLRTILLVGFVLGTISALIIGFIFSQRLLNPIKEITHDVSVISVQNLAKRVSTGKIHDEWYSLANTFNQLLDKLQEGFEVQRRFIANASHEISTPLTSISSQLEVLLEYNRTPDDYRKTVQSVYNDVRQMNKLTQTLLEFASASGNKGGLDINLVRIDEILMELPLDLTKINSSYSVLLNFDNMPENEERLLVYGNEALLKTAIKNVVLNACKYSENHEARIQLKISDGNIIVEITDKGIGISKDEINNIFQPFYRADKISEGRGFGLGLSIANRIIKLHKGFIAVQSVIKQGSKFTITIPSAANLGQL